MKSLITIIRNDDNYILLIDSLCWYDTLNQKEYKDCNKIIDKLGSNLKVLTLAGTTVDRECRMIL